MRYICVSIFNILKWIKSSTRNVCTSKKFRLTYRGRDQAKNNHTFNDANVIVANTQVDIWTEFEFVLYYKKRNLIPIWIWIAVNHRFKYNVDDLSQNLHFIFYFNTDMRVEVMWSKNTFLGDFVECCQTMFDTIYTQWMIWDCCAFFKSNYPAFITMRSKLLTKRDTIL